MKRNSGFISKLKNGTFQTFLATFEVIKSGTGIEVAAAAGAARSALAAANNN